MDETYNWLDDVTRIYRKIVGSAEASEGIQRSEAIALATDELVAMTMAGDLIIPANEAIRAALREVDRTEGQRADGVLKRLIGGQAALDIDGDPLLDVVVTLGSGLRKPWRSVTMQDLMDMDQNRYANYRKVANAYDEWRGLFDPALQILIKYSTVGAAAEAGAFVEPAAA